MPTRLGPLVAALVTAAGLGVAPAPPGLPLTPGQRDTLATAADETDALDPAFDLLAGTVADLDVEPDDLPAAPLAATHLDPDALRGRLFAFRGVVQQTTRRTDADTIECFLRRPGGPPFVVYLVGPDVDLVPPRPGARIEGFGAFYKVLGARARDGSRRTYAAFVGRTVAVEPASPAVAPAALVAGLAVLATALVLLRRRIARLGPRDRVRPITPPVAQTGSLPDDPADALGELARRARNDRPREDQT